MDDCVNDRFIPCGLRFYVGFGEARTYDMKTQTLLPLQLRRDDSVKLTLVVTVTCAANRGMCSDIPQ